MNEAQHETDDQLDHWQALQRELGLTPAEPAAAPKPPLPVPTPAPVAPLPRVQATVVATPPPIVESAPAEPVEADLGRIDTALVLTQEVTAEMLEESLGDAPEAGTDDEEDAGTPGDKRPRRRRRRRRRGGREDARETESPAPAVEIVASMPAAPEPMPVPVLVTAVEEPADEEAPEEVEDAPADPVVDTEEAVEPEPYADWNVPSWQELIASLYRPDR